MQCLSANDATVPGSCLVDVLVMLTLERGSGTSSEQREDSVLFILSCIWFMISNPLEYQHGFRQSITVPETVQGNP